MEEAAVSRDADRACALLEQHIQRTAVNIRERLVSSGTAVCTREERAQSYRDLAGFLKREKELAGQES
ncbi:MAG: hypothetical protein QHC78_07870 [Pigmentiphaga sp.]|uniref:hypothetical protein n=1 Tax=Pigmentiphaga sp. TaxID=1977564 RepID=UPI0029B21E46|nr:hypothetical protein [Pigmentiphaga sp.]MDX3905590.1 hypothetical protein [Pigmentiphaga sp.]